MSTPDASPENTSPVQPRDEIPEEEDSDDEREHSVETDHWKCDLRRVVWNEGGPEWEQNIIDDGQFRELMEVEPTPYDTPSYFLTTKKTGERRFISQSSYPNLYQKIHELIQGRKSAGDLSVNENLIKQVIAVRYDIFDNGSAAYLVEWKSLPDMSLERVDEEWVEETRMPDCYVQAHNKRLIPDTLEYGAIDIPAIQTLASRPMLLSTPESPQTASSLANGSPPAPRASQIFPLSPPNPYVAPQIPLLDDANLGDDSPDEDMPDISELLAQPLTGRSSKREALVQPKIEGLKTGIKPPGSLPAPKTSTKRLSKPQHTATATKSKVVAGSELVSLNTRSPVPSAVAKGKRKADVLTSALPRNQLEQNSKRSKLNISQPTKHERFWQLDGNIIVNIDNTHFKLHRSRLAQQSEYFSDIFDRKDTLVGAGLEDIDGRPMYTVTGVGVKDFEVLLGALDEAITFCYSPPSPESAASILRASVKLSFPAFRNWAIRYFEERWSDDLDDLSHHRLDNAFEVALLGRNNGVKGALKRALYELLRTAGLGIDEGGDKIDDERRAFIAAESPRLVRAREKLNEAWNETLSSAFTSFPCPNAPKDTAQANAKSTTDCPSSAVKTNKWAELVYASGMQQEYAYDALCGLQVLINRNWKVKDGYCEDCVKIRRDAWQKQRVKLWKNLELWLGL